MPDWPMGSHRIPMSPQAELGTTLEEIRRYVVGEQVRRRCLLEETTIPHLVLDAEADPETNLARATDFWLN